MEQVCNRKEGFIINSLYCQYYYEFTDGMAFASFVIFSESSLIYMEKGKKYEVENEYDVNLKAVNYMYHILLSKCKEYTLNKRVVFQIDNEELYLDFLSGSLQENLSFTASTIYQNIIVFIRKENVALTTDIQKYFAEHMLLSTSSNYRLKLYQLISILCLKIIKLNSINGEYNKKLSELDCASQDILHFIELSELSEAKKIEFVDTIKKLRMERRELKEQMEVLSPLILPINKLLNLMNKPFKLSNQTPSKDELLKYKQIFSSKAARENFLKSMDYLQ